MSNDTVKQVRYLHCLLHADFMLGLFSDRADATECSSETSVDVQRTTRSYVVEQRIHNINICLFALWDRFCGLVARVPGYRS
jgi:hypothetical protein